MDNRKKSPLDAEYTSGGNFYAKKLSTHKQLRKRNIRNESTRIDPEIKNELMRNFLTHTEKK